jgi:hypothetical protein
MISRSFVEPRPRAHFRSEPRQRTRHRAAKPCQHRFQLGKPGAREGREVDPPLILGPRDPPIENKRRDKVLDDLERDDIWPLLLEQVVVA